MYLPRISHDLFVLKREKAFKFFKFKILGDEVQNALYKTINMSTETSSACYQQDHTRLIYATFTFYALRGFSDVKAVVLCGIIENSWCRYFTIRERTVQMRTSGRENFK